jgi:uncharacterized protein (TIGR02271 family)
MTMHADQLVGAPVIGSDGQAVGTVEQVFRDDVDGTPSWARVRSRLGKHFVPLAGSRMTKTGLSVPFDTQKIVKEPDLNVDKHMSVGQEEELRQYFGLSVPAQADAAAAGQAQAGTAAGTAAGRTDGAGSAAQAQAGHTQPSATQPSPAQPSPAQPSPAQPSPAQPSPAQQSQGRPAQAGQPADPSMTGQEWLIRAEERVAVSTETTESGRVRLHKYVDVESVEQPVRLSHEEYEIERVPINPGDRISGSVADTEREIVLHEERAIITKETVPVERVRLAARKVDEDKTVRGDIRKERIEVETIPGMTGSGDPRDQAAQRGSGGAARERNP